MHQPHPQAQAGQIPDQTPFALFPIPILKTALELGGERRQCYRRAAAGTHPLQTAPQFLNPPDPQQTSAKHHDL